MEIAGPRDASTLVFKIARIVMLASPRSGVL
jgi:hypothetical protein